MSPLLTSIFYRFSQHGVELMLAEFLSGAA
jgi:hypothetical protein